MRISSPALGINHRVTYAGVGVRSVFDDAAANVTRVELVSLHKALQRHCACRAPEPAVLEEVCAAHQILRDDAAVQRWIFVKRHVQRYVSAEFTAPSAS
jgi:hypothetical protein